MNNVLIITYTFPPHAGGGVQRTLKFAKYLPEYGWCPTVVTIKPYRWKGMDYSLVEEVPQQADVHRCFSLELRRLPSVIQPLLTSQYVMKLRRLIEIPDHCIGWLSFAMRSIGNIVKKKSIDVVYSSFPPGTAHLIGYLVKKKYDIPWVAGYRDPWLANRTPRVYQKLVNGLEKRCITFADKIIVTADFFKEDLQATYPGLTNNKVFTITNGYDEADFSSLSNKTTSSKFNIVYTGYTGPLRLHHFGSAVKQLINNGSIQEHDLDIVIVGNTDGPVSVPDQEIDLDGVPFTRMGYVSHSKSIEYLHQASILLLYSWARNEIPGKTFEYLRAKRPILVLADKRDEVAHLIEESGSGIVVPADNETHIAQAIYNLYCEVRSGYIQHIASDDFIKRYERKELTAKLARIFDQLTV